jgi:hypothetical protein
MGAGLETQERYAAAALFTLALHSTQVHLICNWTPDHAQVLLIDATIVGAPHHMRCICGTCYSLCGDHGRACFMWIQVDSGLATSVRGLQEELRAWGCVLTRCHTACICMIGDFGRHIDRKWVLLHECN